MKLNYQNYKHYKLPITINPLDYGKLIYNKDNIYIIQVTIRTIAIITQFEDFNEIKFFKEGDLVFNYRDHKIDETTFVRTLENTKFTFINNKLTLVNIQKPINLVFLNHQNLISGTIRANILINKLGIRQFSKNLGNIIKLRKISSKYS
jgi:hypothetical protein